MASLKSDKEAIALAQLALQLESPDNASVVGITPSDEELTALYEGQLDDTRRAQVMSHIANNPNVHQRWVQCVDSLAYIDEIESETNVQATSITKPSNMIVEFISNLFKNKILLGSGFSSAVVILFVILLQIQQADINIQLQLNETYSDWGNSLPQEWNTLANDQKPTPVYSSDRSYFSELKQKSDVQKILESGFKMAMTKIGSTPFKDYGISDKNLSNTTKKDFVKNFTSSEYDSLLQTGQIAALAAIQCKLDPASPRLNKLNTALTVLHKQLNRLTTDEANNLQSKMLIHENSCATAEHIINLITINSE
ncbi:hypothetical protein MNBD_GAMMA22-1263 [hydrothermal vent metagenome]|uniref:Uncharacterized protein n=1 Tax=hydrothermal vent metagenome TaxID=652676 RepID=A0A3B0ZRY2_9ZZZZ